MELSLVEKRKEASDAVSFLFRPEKKLEWKPGQFLFYTFKYDNADNRGENRYFTIASAPHEGFVMITTRFLGEKSSSGLKINYLIDPERINEESVQKYTPDFKERIIYLSGPKKMVEDLRKMVKNMGAPKKNIKTDFFPGYEEI